MGTQINTGSAFALPASIDARAGDGNMREGTVVLLDFSRPECWVSSAPVNLAADNAQALVGDPLHPALDGKLANIRLANGALGFGAEGAEMAFPTKLTDYWLGKTIGVSLLFRIINGPASPWRAGVALAIGDRVWSGRNVYTATTAGTTGSAAPTHSTGAVANGSATLTFGVPTTSAPSYGFAIPGPILFLDHDDGFPADYELVSVVAANNFISPPLNDTYGPISAGQINHVTFDPSDNTVNGVLRAPSVGRTVAVEATPTARKVTFRAGLFSDANLYNATAGAVGANTAGVHLDLYRLVIEDLSVSGRTHAEFSAAERRLLRAWHPARDLIA